MAFCVRNLCCRHMKYVCQGHQLSRSSILRTFSSDTSREQDKAAVFRRVLDSFPGVQMAFAYGSGVFQQTGHEMTKNMLDFVFVVDNSVQWHTKNLVQHGDHYSFLSKFGPKIVASYQDNYGAGVYFNTLVPFEDRLIKYGVISKKRLVSDLTDWDSLYISGRLHKPVYFIKQPTCPDVATAIVTNLNSAIHASLLLLPEKFTEEDLFIQITSLSYNGDFRMKFGEDKGKVRKIVAPNMQYFCDLYQSVIEQEEDHVQWNRSSRTLEQSLSSDTRQHHLNHLPKNVLNGIHKTMVFMTVADNTADTDSASGGILETISRLDNCPDVVGQSLAGIVGHSSWRQSIKGIAMAGISKSVKYSSKKVIKMIQGLKNS